MHVRMVHQVLPPGVQHGQESRSRRPGAWDWRPLPGGSAPPPEKHAVDDRWFCKRQGPECVRQREDHMEVRHRQQLRLPRLHPAGAAPAPGTWDSAGCGRSCRRFVGDRSGHTLPRDRPGRPCGSSEPAQHLPLRGGSAVLCQVLVSMLPHHIGYFQPMSGHDCFFASSSVLAT